MVRTKLARCALLLLLASIVGGRAAAAQADKGRVNRAVDKGAAWLKSRQAADGTFKDMWAPKTYPTGETALALLTLLKCGTAPDDPIIDKGFDWLLEQPFKKTYEVSISILALEARHAPKVEAPDPKNPFRTICRKQFQKNGSGREKDWLSHAAGWLVENQKASGLWGYPVGGDPDVPNTQFALLALKSAHRLGIKVPSEVWLNSAFYFIEKQEKAGTGKKVTPFPVPAADGPIDDVEDRKAAAAARGKETQSRTSTTCEARGWGYRQGTVPRGSMTAAGVAAMVVCKSELEGNAQYEKKMAPDVDRSIRDGCAWLADRFAPDHNPGADPDWLFYYLYTLERAGTLSGCDLLGTHDWYAKGADAILNRQKDDGHFEEGTKGETDGTLAGSCLALLFLKRATVPVIEKTYTGGGLAAPTDQPKGGAPGVKLTKESDGTFTVTFRFKPDGSPSSVAIAGSFNSWNKDSTTLTSCSDGTWEVTIKSVAAGKIAYKFVVNGNDWRPDPTATESEDDGHGGKNSVVKVE